MSSKWLGYEIQYSIKWYRSPESKPYQVPYFKSGFLIIYNPNGLDMESDIQSNGIGTLKTIHIKCNISNHDSSSFKIQTALIWNPIHNQTVLNKIYNIDSTKDNRLK
jgi:hypothetical protein